MINTFISNINKKLSVNFNSNNIITGGQKSILSSTLNISINIKRQSFQVSINNNNYKFCECIKWNNGNNMAIFIGLNPSNMLHSNLDKTNELITYKCYKKYDGYYLFNIYPLVQSKGFTKSGYKCISPNYGDMSNIIADTINAYISNNNITTFDLIYFFGSSFYVNKDILYNLNKISNANLYTCGTINKNHKHPGRGISYKKIEFNKRNTNKIVLINGYYK